MRTVEPREDYAREIAQLSRLIRILNLHDGTRRLERVLAQGLIELLNGAAPSEGAQRTGEAGEIERRLVRRLGRWDGEEENPKSEGPIIARDEAHPTAIRSQPLEALRKEAEALCDLTD